MASRRYVRTYGAYTGPALPGARSFPLANIPSLLHMLKLLTPSYCPANASSGHNPETSPDRLRLFAPMYRAITLHT